MIKNRIIEKNKDLFISKKKAFTAYLSAGFPDIKTTHELVDILINNKVDFIELGMPFSDPVADGPVIQKASAMALDKGMSMIKYLKIIKDLRKKTEVPLIIMSYYNPIFKYGISKFAKDASLAGLDGVIVPDLPPEEAEELNNALLNNSICQIFLISPLTSFKRMQKISRISRGFIYYISLAGVTGTRDTLGADLLKQVRLIKKTSKTPVFVGFGVSKPEHVKKNK
ncbi:MAG: tryptophan synthase subunit alpha [Candidatus Omnitrophica bacterium]|nr:tryptophan synthase subunit alpha [Candidatus Omnitrophota bacterium]